MPCLVAMHHPLHHKSNWLRQYLLLSRWIPILLALESHAPSAAFASYDVTEQHLADIARDAALTASMLQTKAKRNHLPVALAVLARTSTLPCPTTPARVNTPSWVNRLLANAENPRILLMLMMVCTAPAIQVSLPLLNASGVRVIKRANTRPVLSLITVVDRVRLAHQLQAAVCLALILP